MIIQGTIPFTSVNIPEDSALSRCAMFTTQKWRDEDGHIIHKSLSLFAAWEKDHPIPFWKERSFNLYVLYQETISVAVSKPLLGTTATVIFLRMDRILLLYPHPICFAIVLEELCHAYYMIQDEHQVKELVIRRRK